MRWRLWSNKHKGYWRPHSLGYTPHEDEAGVFGTVTAMTVLMKACDDVEWMSTNDIPKTVAINVETDQQYVLVEWTDDPPNGGTPLSIVERDGFSGLDELRKTA